MENKNVLNDKELQQVNGGMVPFLEDVSGSEFPNDAYRERVILRDHNTTDDNENSWFLE